MKTEQKKEGNQGDRSMIARFERITRPVPLIATSENNNQSSENNKQSSENNNQSSENNKQSSENNKSSNNPVQLELW